MICNIMFLQIMRWRPVFIKQAILFGELTDWYLNFRWAACQPRIIWNYVRMQKMYSEKYYVCQDFGRNYPIYYV